jgi:hypothetical protein
VLFEGTLISKLVIMRDITQRSHCVNNIKVSEPQHSTERDRSISKGTQYLQLKYDKVSKESKSGHEGAVSTVL